MKNAAEALIPAEEAFAELDVRIPSQLHEVWAQQEKLALENRGMDPKLMDIFEVQLEKGMEVLKSLPTRLTYISQLQQENPLKWIL